MAQYGFLGPFLDSASLCLGPKWSKMVPKAQLCIVESNLHGYSQLQNFQKFGDMKILALAMQLNGPNVPSTILLVVSKKGYR